MSVKLLNVVVFASDYAALINWYKEAFELTILLKEDAVYHYTELGCDGSVIVGITPAAEVDHKPTELRNNSAVMQILVSDIKSTFNRVKKYNGSILFGPSVDEVGTFLYGAVSDIEGNQIWVIQNSNKNH